MPCIPTRKTYTNSEDIKRSVKHGPRMDDIFFGSAPGIAPSVVEIPRVLQLVVRSSEYASLSSPASIIKKPSFSKGVPLEKLYRLCASSHSSDDDVLPKDDESIGIPPMSSKTVSHDDIPLGAEKKELDAILQKEDERDVHIANAIRRRNILSVGKRPEDVLTSLSEAARLQNDTTPKRAASTKTPMLQKPAGKPEALREVLTEKKEQQHAIKKAVSRSFTPSRKILSYSRPAPKTIKKQGASHPHQKEDLSFLVDSREKDIVKPQSLRWPEAFRVAAASTAAAVLVTMLGLLGSLPRTSVTVAALGGSGADHLRSGLSSMLALDVTAGEKEFSAAAEQFRKAEETLYESTTAIQRLIAHIDPAARYTSGKSLLEAGKRLASLQEEASSVALLFVPEAHRNESLTNMLRRQLPAIVKLAEGLNEVDELLDNVRTDTLPENMREQFSSLVGGIRAITGVATTYVDSHEVLLELLGGRVDRTYLMLFQNNREIRATGGFIGSFALVHVSEGEVENINVDTIYNPDGQLHELIIPPQPLQRITDKWYTRDANWFAHFPHSARKVASMFERSGGPTVDGVITVTPDVLERILDIIGEIDMPEYGITVTSENVIDETQRLTTFEYDRSADHPKAFMADLLPEIMDMLANSEQEHNTLLVQVLGEALDEKHILIWFRDMNAQDLVRRLGWGGMVAETGTSDYLMRVESNIGGHKTDHLIETSVRYDVSIESDGTATATLVTTRHHTGSKQARQGVNLDEDWMTKANVVYERVLVPRGSKLLETRGFTDEHLVPTPFENTADYRAYTPDEDVASIAETLRVSEDGTRIMEEAGKTVFGNWIVTQPGETTVTVYRYHLPMQFETRTIVGRPFSYRLTHQHQPGHKPVEFAGTVRLPPGFNVAYAGPEDIVRVESRAATFTTTISRDTVIGIVAERI